MKATATTLHDMGSKKGAIPWATLLAQDQSTGPAALPQPELMSGLFRLKFSPQRSQYLSLNTTTCTGQGQSPRERAARSDQHGVITNKQSRAWAHGHG